MTPKVKKKAPALPELTSKQTLKVRKAVLKRNQRHTHKRKSTCHPPSRGHRHHGYNGSLNILISASPGEPSLTTMPVPRPAGHWIHCEREDSNTLMFFVEVKAINTGIRQAGSFPGWVPVTSFYCLTLLARKSITMNRSGKSRRPCLVLIFKGKLSGFHH